MMALGVVQFLAETGRTSVAVAAFDALDEAKKAIREGSLQATVDQQAAQQGYLGVSFAVRALNGEKLPLITLVETRLVTADSVDK
jgi:ribose transport system substrate-binding protein